MLPTLRSRVVEPTMPRVIARGLPTSLLLMAVAVILILSGSGAAGLTFGLVVAGVGGVLLFSALIYDAAHGEDRPRPRRNRVYRAPRGQGGYSRAGDPPSSQSHGDVARAERRREREMRTRAPEQRRARSVDVVALSKRQREPW